MGRWVVGEYWALNRVVLGWVGFDWRRRKALGELPSSAVIGLRLSINISLVTADLVATFDS